MKLKPFVRFLLVALVVMVIVGVIFKITRPTQENVTKPGVIPEVSDVVPKGFSTQNAKRVLDAREAGPLLSPNLPIVKISDSIVEISCSSGNILCKARSLYVWTSNKIEHTEVLPSRDHVISPEETIIYGQGDSVTKSILLASLLRAQGLQTRVGLTPYSAFTETIVAGQTYRLDPGCGSCSFGETRYTGANSSIYWIS